MGVGGVGKTPPFLELTDKREGGKQRADIQLDSFIYSCVCGVRSAGPITCVEELPGSVLEELTTSRAA